MSTIHQIYCTHCTHARSALERREGEIAHRMLGYSARAGSLSGHELRNVYRQIERYVYHYLPRDTPAEEKLRLTAAAAPRRLVYLPSISGLQVVCQICYRQKDTEGRPGSYFAHVLLRRQQDGQPPWSPVDCLKLWRAPGWVVEDGPDIPFLLDSLSSLDELLLGSRPAIDDAVFHDFLMTPAGGAFDDPAGVIPPRWRHAPDAQRRALFADAFRGFGEVSGQGRQSFLLVAEPSLAALLFYGILRLLPRGPIQRLGGFSTFEPNTDRLTSAFAGTVFYDPTRTDLRPEAYRSGGYVLNTFSNRSSERRQQQAHYAESMIELLVDGGWDAVNRRLHNLESAGAQKWEDLEGLAAVDRLVPALFNPQGPPPNDDWRRSPMATGYLRRVLKDQLSGLEDAPARLKPMIGRPAHLIVLEMIATDPIDPAVFVAADYLLRTLPAEMISRLIKLEPVSAEAKIDVLVRHVTAHSQLPPACEHLWKGPFQPVDSGTAVVGPLLPQLLSRLDTQTLEALYKNTEEQFSDAFLEALLVACGRTSASRLPLTQIVGVTSDEALLSLFRTLGPEFMRDYPRDEPELGQRLQAILHSITDHPEQFPERLDFVLAGEHLLPDDKDVEMANGWRKCRRAMTELGKLQGQKSGVLRAPPVEAMEKACREMAEAAAKAMPSDRFADDGKGVERRNSLVRIGTRVVGGSGLLPRGVWQHEALWQKVTRYFETGTWSHAPLKKITPRGVRMRPLLLVILAALGLAGLVWAYSSTRDTGEPGSATVAKGRSKAEPPEAEPNLVEPAESETEPAESLAPEVPSVPQPDAVPEIANPPSRAAIELMEAESLAGASQEEPAELAKSEHGDKVEAEPDGAPPQQAPAQLEKPQPTEQEADAGPAEETPAEPAELSEEEWKNRAREFADRRGGLFLEGARLVEARVHVPWKAIPSRNDPPQVLLGPGILEVGSRKYRFGGGFDAPAPVTKHDIPRLAIDLGLDAVFVELKSRDAALEVEVGGKGVEIPPELAEEREQKIEAFKRHTRKIQARLRSYSARSATDEDRDEAYDDLIELLGMEIPTVPNRPSPYSDEFKGKNQEYQAALRRYDDAVAARNRARGSVIPTAKATAAKLQREVDEMEAEQRRLEAGVRRDNLQLLAELKEQCRAVSVVVYPSEAVLAEDPTTKSSLAPNVDSDTAPLDPGPDNGAQVPEVLGELTMETKRASGLAPPYVARIEPAVAGRGGVGLPAWHRDNVVAGCRVVEIRQGGRQREIPLPDLSVTRSARLLRETSAVRCRFTFSYRRPGDPITADPVLFARTAWHVVEPIEAGKQYSVKLELDKAGLDQLRALIPAGKEP